MVSLRRAVNLLIYLSVAMGVALLPQLYPLVPSWLFYSVFIGWLAYVVVAVLAASGRKVAYPLAFVLAVLTLAVSLPQPEHYSFGASLASATFLIGSVLQIALLVLVPVYLRRSKSGKAQVRETISTNSKPSRATCSPTSTCIGCLNSGQS